jgi:uncharacterized membrane protein YraQ (UPF0718 family)
MESAAVIDSGVVLWLIALAFGLLVARRGRHVLIGAIRSAVQNLVVILPRICLALILAGFVAKLIPTAMIGQLIGYGTGWQGIALAIVFGGMMPSGPMIAFPVVVVLRAADAGAPQIIAFLTAWSVFAWHRVLIYEITMLGWQFTAARLGASIALPAIGGALAYAICAATGLR